jgi:hypothetical protein
MPRPLTRFREPSSLTRCSIVHQDILQFKRENQMEGTHAARGQAGEVARLVSDVCVLRSAPGNHRLLSVAARLRCAARCH